MLDEQFCPPLHFVLRSWNETNKLPAATRAPLIFHGNQLLYRHSRYEPILIDTFLLRVSLASRWTLSKEGKAKKEKGKGKEEWWEIMNEEGNSRGGGKERQKKRGRKKRRTKERRKMHGRKKRSERETKWPQRTWSKPNLPVLPPQLPLPPTELLPTSRSISGLCLVFLIRCIASCAGIAKSPTFYAFHGPCGCSRLSATSHSFSKLDSFRDRSEGSTTPAALPSTEQWRSDFFRQPSTMEIDFNDAEAFDPRTTGRCIRRNKLERARMQTKVPKERTFRGLALRIAEPWSINSLSVICQYRIVNRGRRTKQRSKEAYFLGVLKKTGTLS